MRLPKSATLAERFHVKVDRQGPNECWNWIGAQYPNRYGKVWSDGRRLLAHRVAYELEHGSIRSDLTIDHLCRNTLCCNPAHLEQVTGRENTRRRNAAAGPATTPPRRHAVRPSDFGGSLVPSLRARPGVNQNTAKTHCAHGHPYDEANTRLDRRGRRNCRACARAQWHAKAARKVAANG